MSITSDGWSSITGDSYMSLTAHYIDHDWCLHTSCLKTQYHPESHTATNISNFLLESLAEYGLRRGNITAITTDSAANMVAAAREASKYIYIILFLGISSSGKDVSFSFDTL